MENEPRQMRQEWGREVRHVAGDDDRHLAAALHECGLQSAEWTAPRRPIGRRTDMSVRRVSADDDHVVGQPGQFINLPIQDRPAVDDEGALVVSAEPRGPSSGENGGGDYHAAGLTLAILPGS